MRPSQRWRRLNVSNEIPRSFISGLFLPARTNRGIYNGISGAPVRGVAWLDGGTHQVRDGQCARPVSELGSGSCERGREGDVNHTEHYIDSEVAGDEQQLEARGKGADIDGGADLELAVVPLPEDWRI